MHTNAQTGEVICVRKVHIHPSNLARVEATIAITSLKRRAESSQEGTAQVINNSLKNVPVAVQGQLPDINALKKVVRRKRVQGNLAPPNPVNLTDLIIPQGSVQRRTTAR